MLSDRSDDPLAPLAHRIRDGDVDAFEELFRALHAPLCEVVDSFVGSQDVAEEIVQDLFLLLWVERARFPSPRSLRAYLFTAARNRALHHLRHRSVARRWIERTMGSPAECAGEAHRPPDRALEASESARAVRAAIDRLPPRTRLAFVLQWEYEMSHDQIATAMGITNKGVEKLLAAAKSKLRALLGSYATTVLDPTKKS